MKRDTTEATRHALVALGDRGGPGARDSEKGGPSGRGRSRWYDSRQPQQRQQRHQQQEATGISAESSKNCNNHIWSSGGNNSCSAAVGVVVGENRGSHGTLEDPAPGQAVQVISMVNRKLGTREDVYRHALPFKASMTFRDTRQNLPSPVGNQMPVHGADPRRSRRNCIELQHIHNHCPWRVDPGQPMPPATAHLARVVPSPEVISPLVRS